MLTIDMEIFNALDTGKKMAQDKPDRLIIFFYKTNSYNARVYKIFNDDKVPFFELRASTVESMTSILGSTLIDEKISFQFEDSENKEFSQVKKNIDIMFFKKWLKRTKNIFQGDTQRMEMAFNKLK